MDPTFATATELAGALRHRTISSRELLDHQLARIENTNPRLNAVVALDVERARAAAGLADDATARGDVTGPLHGLPMTVKDVWETEGLSTTSGSPDLKDHVPQTDALAVARLKDAGAVIFGKTNTPPYAGDFQTFNELYGVTNNPWDITRTAGGSSGGAAVAVAAGMTPLEVGSDLGGSIRNPAHYNGVYGLKPTWGLVPNRGHIPGPPGTLVETDVNCGGPIVRSLGDLRTALGVLAGPVPEEAVGWRLDLDPGPVVHDVRGLRVATVFHEGADLVPIAADVSANLDAYAGRLSDAGAQMEAVPMPVSLADGLRTWQRLVLPIMGIAMPDDDFAAFAELEAVAGDDPLWDAARSFACRYRTWAVANGLRQRQRALWAAFFEDYDVVLAPVMPTVAFSHDIERPIMERVVNVDGLEVPHVVAMAWCGAIGAMLLPVVTVPTGPTPDGSPVGVQLIGPYLSDYRLLAQAEAIDAAAGPGFASPPS